MENTISETFDNGVIENVHIAPIGDFNGSDQKGNPVPEHITKESLEALADKLNSGDEVLMDVDHKSAKAGADKDTSAVGWFHKFIVDPVKGLFATLKLTAKGKEIFQNREYRYTSPTFMLNDNGEPVDLHSVAATNLPAFKGFISPILNSEATQISNPQEEIIDMTKEEVVQLIRETVAQIKAEKEAAEAEEAKKAAETQNEAVPEQKKEITDAEKAAEANNEEVPEKSEGEKLAEELKKAENACGAKNECGECKKEEEVKNECGEEKKAEVIKEEVLNSQPIPQINQEAEWKKLSGKAFFDWLAKHPEAR